MNGIQIKTYLSLNNDNEEIRRFNLELNAGETGLYKKLYEKIESVYGSMLENANEVRTYYMDEENDLVGFKSDAEMQYAIDLEEVKKKSNPYHKNLMLKVYIKKIGIKNRCNFEAEPQVHLGVVCDNCDGSIIGNRYKCTTCPDYDLCEECKNKSIHKEHSFNKITKPECHLNGNKFGGPHMGAHWGAHWNAHNFGAQNFGGHNWNGPRCQGRQSKGKHCKKNNPFQQIFKQFMDIPQYAADNAPLINNPENLKNFGENLKKILDPFGIDVSYYVDNMTNGNYEKPKQEKKEAEKEKFEENENTAEKSTENQKANSENESAKTSIMDQSIEDINDLKVNEPTVASKSSIDTNENVASAPTENEELIDSQNSINARYEMAIKKIRNMVPINNNEKINEEEKNQDDSIIDDSNLIGTKKQLKIINTIEQLKTMGYSDEDGWLTRLVSAKNGNINRVLNTISRK